MNQVRPLRWHDFPLAYRLIGHGTSFDAQFSLTLGDDGLRQNLLTNSGNTHAYVLRRGGGGGFAVLRGLPGTQYAGLGYMAPALDNGGSEEQWLEMIEGMSILAAQQGIVGIRAEANDDTPEFALLREADFGVYAHQTLWERPASPVERKRARMRAATADEVNALLNTMQARSSAMLRLVNVLQDTHTEYFALETRHSGSAMAAITRGHGRTLIDLLVMPDEARGEIKHVIDALVATAGAESTAITCRLRHDMEWIGRSLTEVGFDWVGSQAILVRHTMAHVRRHALKEVTVKKGLALTTSQLRELDPARSEGHDTTALPV